VRPNRDGCAAVVVVAGHVCADLIPAISRPLEIVPGEIVPIGALTIRAGGCVGNTGIGLAELGADVRLAAAVGDDELGETLRHLLRQKVSATEGVVTVEGASTSYSIVLEHRRRDRAFWHHVGANNAFDEGLVEIDACDLLHIGYPPLLPRLIRNGGAPLRGLLANARARNVATSLDFAAVQEGARFRWEAVLRRVLPLTDIATPSIDDVATMLGSPSMPRTPREVRRRLEDIAEIFLRMGVAVVLVTAGPHGALLRTADESRIAGAGRLLSENATGWAGKHVYSPSAAADIVSTRGAGDAATAGLLRGVLNGGSPDEALALAMDAAAACVAGRPLTNVRDERKIVTA